MLPAYPEYPEEVSLDQIEQAFLADKEMYLTGMLNDIFCLQIYHSEEEDAENDECELILMVGDLDEIEEDSDDSIGLHSLTHTLDEVIHHFKLDRTKAMWFVAKDDSELLPDEELDAE